MLVLTNTTASDHSYTNKKTLIVSWTSQNSRDELATAEQDRDSKRQRSNGAPREATLVRTRQRVQSTVGLVGFLLRIYRFNWQNLSRSLKASGAVRIALKPEVTVSDDVH